MNVSDRIRRALSLEFDRRRNANDAAPSHRLIRLAHRAADRRATVVTAPGRWFHPTELGVMLALLATMGAVVLVTGRFEFVCLAVIAAPMFGIILIARRGERIRIARARASTAQCRRCTYACADLPTIPDLPPELARLLGPRHCPECGTEWPIIA